MFKIIIFVFFIVFSAYGKEYSLSECLEAAAGYSWYSAQQGNYNKISEIETREILSNYYPQFNIDAQASYQSDVFTFPLKFPGISFPELRKDQYNVGLNVQQLIWDGGTLKANETLSEISAQANTENAKAKIRNTVEQVGTLYFSALKIKASGESILSAISTLESNKKQLNSMLENGIMLRSSFDAIEIQISSKQQNLLSLQKDYLSVLQSISRLTGLTDLTEVKPEVIRTANYKELPVERNELNSIDKYKELNSEKVSLFKTSLMPKVSAFAKFGYSNPNQFNMFEQEWTGYYIAGFKLIWKPFSWFSEQRNLEIAELQNQNLDIEKQEFTRQLNIQLEKEYSEAEKAEALLNQDNTIIELQKKIIKDKYSQVINGTATVSEYINEINSLQQYEINLSLHKIMLGNAQSNILIKSGNYKGLAK